MPTEYTNITGKRFGRWTALERDPYPSSNNSYWIVQCDCGAEGSVRYSELKSGHSTQCRSCRNKATTVNKKWVESGIRASLKKRGFTWKGTLS